MTDTPEITVVISCFNYGEFLADAVESVLAQRGINLAVTVVDDGSTDDSLAIARAIADRDPRVTVIAQENSGTPAIPRNRAIEAATTPFIACLDADDMYEPDALRVCVDVLEADPALGIAYPQQRDVGRRSCLQDMPVWSIDGLAAHNFLPSGSVFRRQAWVDAGGYRTDVGYEDWDFWLGIVAAGWSAAPAEGAVWCYRHHGESRFTRERANDQEIKARIILNHQVLYPDTFVAWAERVMRGEEPVDVNAPAGLMPRLASRRDRVSIASDASTRADWYLERDDIESPWPGLDLAQALARVDMLGYSEVHSHGQRVAHRRASSPLACPVPFPRRGDSTEERLEAVTASIGPILTIAATTTTEFRPDSIVRALGIPAARLPMVLEATSKWMNAPGSAPPQHVDHRDLHAACGLLLAQQIVHGTPERIARASEIHRVSAAMAVGATRNRLVLSFASELEHAPEMLSAYGRTIDEDDDVTLAIIGDTPERVPEILQAAGLDLETCPDMVATARLPEVADAVLSRQPFGAVRRFDETNASNLRSELGLPAAA